MSGQNGKGPGRDRDRARAAGGDAPPPGRRAPRRRAPGRRAAATPRAPAHRAAARRPRAPAHHVPAHRPGPPEDVGYTGFTGRPNPGRIAAYFGLAVLGALVALAGTLVQAAWFPGGLVIALAGSAGLFYGGRILTGTQIGALAPAVGWFITVFLLLSGRPEGDYVFGDELGLALFMLGGTAVAVMCATTSKVPQSATRRGRSGI
ncbi:hypothetical protein EQG64_23715 [Streptomyces sp. S6]|nr:hypothetical protein EQG64_23715 [Streptomyces sp. S6]